VLMVL